MEINDYIIQATMPVAIYAGLLGLKYVNNKRNEIGVLREEYEHVFGVEPPESLSKGYLREAIDTHVKNHLIANGEF